MKVKRIMHNTATSDINKAAAFCRDRLGLKIVYRSRLVSNLRFRYKMSVHVSFGSEGGSGTSVPDLSIEVDNVEVALARFKKENIPIEYGPISEPWGVQRFYVRDPFKKLTNILQHE